jgi:acid phosphatase type 7
MRVPRIVSHLLPVALPLVALLAVLTAGCDVEDDVALDPVPFPDAGVSADAGGNVLPCGPTGISKGPWSLAATETTVTLRWEACAPGTISEVTYTPELGGDSLTVASVETATVITTTVYASLLKSSIPADLAGIWYMHEADLTGLAPSTCYLYVLGADPTRKGRFCTARLPGDPVRVMTIGDTSPGLGRTPYLLADVLPQNPDFVLHGGDMQYYSTGLETWASWFPPMEPMLAQGAIFPAVGNHEMGTPDDYVDYYTRFFGDAGFDGPNDNTYFRYETGGVWFFALDTQLSIAKGSPQATWLEAMLADAVTRPGFRFSIVYMHRPLLTCGDTADDLTDQETLEPLFFKYRVPFVVQAHMHGYERFEYHGITYLTSAGGGGAIGNPSANQGRPECAFRVAWGAFFNASILEIQEGDLVGKTIDDHGALRDTFERCLPY